MNNPIFTINSKKFDDSIHRSWNCELISNVDALYIFEGKFSEEIHHPQIGVIRRNTRSTEFFWLDKYFSVFKFETDAGKLVGFYYNINLPPIINNNILDFIDLDIDVYVDSNFNIRILDEDEFSINSEKYQYPTELVLKVRKTLDLLLELIANREFPFNSS
ncbi:MAG TPA: DUF402 domain-containing protein [Pyrinomonadaceae bacterium]|nr:DUF402 domain-containing protein [Pyrinomonadaceae bacterium]